MPQRKYIRKEMLFKTVNGIRKKYDLTHLILLNIIEEKRADQFNELRLKADILAKELTIESGLQYFFVDITFGISYGDIARPIMLATVGRESIKKKPKKKR